MPAQESFNEDFCVYLEYHLCEAFAKSGSKDLKDYWCDGVSWVPSPTSQLGKKQVNDTRKIVTKAYIGPDGQDVYEMMIRFGNYALRRYAKGSSLIDCIPSSDSMDWITIHPDQRTIEIRLR